VAAGVCVGGPPAWRCTGNSVLLSSCPPILSSCPLSPLLHTHAHPPLSSCPTPPVCSLQEQENPRAILHSSSVLPSIISCGQAVAAAGPGQAAVSAVAEGQGEGCSQPGQARPGQVVGQGQARVSSIINTTATTQLLPTCSGTPSSTNGKPELFPCSTVLPPIESPEYANEYWGTPVVWSSQIFTDRQVHFGTQKITVNSTVQQTKNANRRK
jgi:hypothetical protein